MLVTAVVKARAQTLLDGQFAGQVTAVATGEERPFAGCEELVEFLTAAARGRGDTVRPPPGALLGDLTPRQRQVLGLVAAGQTNAEVAAELGISVGTVRKHLERIFRSIGARNRADAVARVLRETAGGPRIDPGAPPPGGGWHGENVSWPTERDEVHTLPAGMEGDQ